MLIAIIAVLHVIVAHYAVGGGFFLAREITFAHRTRDQEYLAYLHRHAAFFILLTVVFGAITGVGIWWTIGLASPLATALLIQVFVFGWATEWVFFVMELTSAFLLYYAWTRIPAWLRESLAWIYAIAAWISLLLITGITSFMLHSGTWPETRNFWHGFFNPQFWPQVIARTGAALLLSALYVFLHASLTLPSDRLRELVQKRAGLPSFLGAAGIGLGGFLWFLLLPDSAGAVILTAPIITAFVVAVASLTVLILAMVYFASVKNPSWLNPGYAGLIFFLGLGAFTLGEFVREAVRKPYIVDRVVLGNQIFLQEIPKLRQEGYLQSGIWTRYYVAEKFPKLIEEGKINYERFKELNSAERVALGQALFMYHCNDCHATSLGYSAVAPFLYGMTADKIKEFLLNLNEPYFYMPPWCGREEEAEVLAEYLATLAPRYPQNLPRLPHPISKTEESAEALTAGHASTVESN
jgi:cytochrome bd-type quinol oxidase subunit 1